MGVGFGMRFCISAKSHAKADPGPALPTRSPADRGPGNGVENSPGGGRRGFSGRS